MRVTIEHRQETGGVAGQRRTYFVDCTVAFSEEERAIVKARDLYGHDIVTRAAAPLPSTAAFIGTGFMRTGGRLLIVAAIVVGIASTITRSGEGLSSFMLFSGIGLEIYGWRRGRRQDKRLEEPQQTIRLRQLLSNPRFTVHALDPVHAKAVEDEIRSQLVALKDLIKGSAELGQKQTFEL